MSRLTETSPPIAGPASGTLCRTQLLSKTLSRRRVLDRIDLTIERGDVIALTGSNGAGKTTLLRCLSGATRPTSGEVSWFAMARSDGTSHRLDTRSQHRLHVGFVAHDTRLYRDLSAWENLVFAARMCGLRDVAQHAEKWLEVCGLAAHARRRVQELSRGMQQRVAVARALIHEPALVLLDEPFTGLDTAGCRWMCNLLRGMTVQQRAIVFVTHESRWVEALANRVLVLDRGRLCERDAGCADMSAAGIQPDRARAA